MRRLIAGSLALGTAVLVLAGSAEAPRRERRPKAAPSHAEAGLAAARPAMRSPAVSFLPDGAESGPGASFVARGGGMAATIGAAGAIVNRLEPVWTEDRVRRSLADPSLYVNAMAAPRRAHPMRIAMIGGDAGASASVAQPLGFLTNVHLGDDPSKWRRDVTSYARATFANVWPGIDVAWHGESGRLEFDFVVAPGADPSVIAMWVDDPADPAVSVRLDDSGALVFGDGPYAARLGAPVVYQEREGDRVPVDGRYICGAADDLGRARVTFALAGYDRSRPLVIDPAVEVLESVRIGGTGNDNMIATLPRSGGAGGLLCVMSTTQPFTPDTTGLGGLDVLIAEYDGDGALVRRALLGGAADDFSYDAVTTPGGNALIVGTTASAGFPRTNGTYQGTGSATRFAFVAEFDANLALLRSASVGWGGYETFWNAAFGLSGSVIVSGTTSSNLPTTPGAAMGSAPVGAFAAPFLASFSADLQQLTGLTWIGPNYASTVGGLATLTDGTIVVAVSTIDGAVATVGATQPAGAGGTDVFFAQLSANLTAVLHSGYLGGTGYDFCFDVVPHPTAERVYLGGVVGGSAGFGIPNASAFTFPGNNDEFVACFDPALPVAERTSFVSVFGSTGNEIATAMAILGDRLMVVGYSDDPQATFPILDPPAGHTRGGGASDASFHLLDLTGQTTDEFIQSWLAGGDGADIPSSVKPGSVGTLLVGATTQSSLVPTTGGSPGTNASVLPAKDDCWVLELGSPPCERPDQPSPEAYVSPARGGGGELSIRLYWKTFEPPPPVSGYVIEEAVLTQDLAPGAQPTFTTIDPVITEDVDFEGYPTRRADFNVRPNGQEKRIYRVTAYNDCGESAPGRRAVVLTPMKSPKVRNTEGGIEVIAGDRAPAPFSVEVDADVTITGSEADVDASKLMLELFELTGPGKKPKPAAARFEGKLTIPAGQTRVFIPTDTSVLSGPVKIQLALTINGKTKKSTVKLKPPKVKKR